jgi:hypothetical protein
MKSLEELATIADEEMTQNDDAELLHDFRVNDSCDFRTSRTPIV